MDVVYLFNCFQDYLKFVQTASMEQQIYGRLKCFHCLLSPAGDDPILIGINRLVSKGLIDGEQCAPEYPCQVVNRFQCPYKRTNVKEDRDIEAPTPDFDVDDLFRLHKMAFIVEIALAKARKADSEIQIKDKQDLLHALKDRNTFIKILQQANDILKSTEYFREITAGQDANYIADYFMRIRDKITLEDLRFY